VQDENVARTPTERFNTALHNQSHTGRFYLAMIRILLGGLPAVKRARDWRWPLRLGVLLGAVVLLRHTTTLAEEASPSQTPTAATPSYGKVNRCKPGRWGDLQYYYVYLEPPEQLLQQMVVPDPVPKWHFPDGTDASVRELFARAGLPAGMQTMLLDPAGRLIKDGVLTVFPHVSDLLAMTPAQRAVIYAELGKSPLNPYCADPVFIADGDADAWLAQSQIRPELGEAVKRMVYRRGDMVCFSDVSAVLSMTQSEKEARDLIRTMWRTRSLVLQLNVREASDVARAMEYWSGSGPDKAVASIVLPGTNGVQQLDCVHLLPHLPRRWLYTYPSDDLMLSAPVPDCNWTSLNFFESTPFFYHLDSRVLQQRLQAAYVSVEAPFRFGDVLMLRAPDNTLVHSCVYIADDIVFTKNGHGRLSPWYLTKLDDLMRVYSWKEAVTLRGFRLKRHGRQT
jgi:hypothetical protein